jgi:hypothetical protein
MTAASPRELARQRQRRYRERIRDGRRIVPVEVDASIIEDALVRRRFLRREDAEIQRRLPPRSRPPSCS